MYLFAASTIWECSDYVLYNKVMLRDAIGEIKAGDLLLFSSNKYYSNKDIW